MKVICISDLHQQFVVDKDEQHKLTVFYSFIDSLIAHPPDKFIIAGDLFDVWFEYSMVIPKAFFMTFHKLKTLAECGTEIIYVAGNHDFVFRDFFQAELQAKVFRDNHTFTCAGKKFFVSHGDEYTSNDLQYHVLKSILRNQIVHKLFSWIHPDVGLRTGKLMSRSSRDFNKSRKTLAKQEKGLIDFSKKLFDKGYDYTIMGHIHSPKMLELEKGSYINLGDWIKHFSYLEINDKSVELKFWNATNYIEAEES